MSTIVSRTLSVHQEHEFLRKLEAAGLTDKLAQRVIGSKGNKLAELVVAYIQHGGYVATKSQNLARKIMGENFLGIEEAIQHFGRCFSEPELQALAEIPFSETVLHECKDTHILVCVPSLSILDIRGKVENRLFFSHDDAWYNEQRFANNNGKFGWRLVRKTAVPDSNSKNWEQQQKLLPKGNFVPDTRTITYTIICHYLATGKLIFNSDYYVRTSDVDSVDCHVSIGYFGFRGLNISSFQDDDNGDNLCLASARKS